MSNQLYEEYDSNPEELGRFMKEFCPNCINLKTDPCCCIVEDILACMKEQKEVGEWK